MEVNADKFCIYAHRVLTKIMSELKKLFQFKFEQMEDGFRYLGFNLKPDNCCVKDWFWLIKRIEKRITYWSYIFLSMGGSLTLINETLQSIPVYWCSLVVLPKYIINTLREKCFHFSWEGTRNERKFHLASWEQIVVPKYMGGWGIKHLTSFNTTLCLTSMWRCLFIKAQLWSMVMRTKYLNKMTSNSWFKLI